MRTRFTTALTTVLLSVFSGALLLAIGPSGQQSPSSAAPASSVQVERGAYLVRAMGCNDCHTPLKMGPRGPEPDMARALTGHPQDLLMPPAPAPSGPWIWHGAATNTAFAGPWGVSFAANLTPDKETGLGSWTVEMFIATMKTGRHQGKGRHLLPPMPYPVLGGLTDEDIRSVFAYLQSLAPVKNRVPTPVDPVVGGDK
jgi:mono/diheme cytochrome c family protein